MLGETVVPVGKPLVLKEKGAPKKYPCPVCGRLGRRERTRTHMVRHLAHKREAYIEATVGVYKAQCKCRKRYFTSTVPGVELGAEYSNAVREKVVDLLIRDRLSNYKVLEHLKEDFLLEASMGWLYLCLDWARKRGILKPTAVGA